MIRKIKRTLVLTLLAAILLPGRLYGTPDTDAITGDALPLESEFSILVDVATGRILHDVGAHQRAYPASMTKVMTTLLLLESSWPMDMPIFHNQGAIDSVVPWHSPIYTVVNYLTIEEALYSMMLRSANDVSNAVAEFLGGTQEEFARMMTARAHELGAVNTNFTNAHGLWEPYHYTTPYDMALIMREAIRHDKFLEIINAQRFFIDRDRYNDSDGDPYRMLENTNRAIFPANTHFNPDIVGGKTGFTNNSRNTLVSYGQRSGMGLISVIMRADSRDIIYTDTRLLMDFGFDQFEHQTVFSAADFEYHVNLVQRSNEGVLLIGGMELRAAEDVVFPLPVGFDGTGITAAVHTADRIVVPVPENFAVGQVVLKYNGDILAEVDLHTARAAAELTAEELAGLFPAPVALAATYYTPTVYDDDNFSVLRLISNISLVLLGILLFGFLVIRFLRFSHRRRRRARAQYMRRGRGHSSPYNRKPATTGNLRYRYK
ncbi:MAG: hypothetical protein FWC93_03690 [Defluviitaleaceae bacterium]|nr:hypothetical protein [Defluviitaleaceae bacterium]